MRIILKAFLLLFLLQFCAPGFCRDELEFNQLTGMWTYRGGSLTPLDDSFNAGKNTAGQQQENTPAYQLPPIIIPDEVLQYSTLDSTALQSVADAGIANETTQGEENSTDESQSKDAEGAQSNE